MLESRRLSFATGSCASGPLREISVLQRRRGQKTVTNEYTSRRLHRRRSACRVKREDGCQTCGRSLLASGLLPMGRRETRELTTAAKEHHSASHLSGMPEHLTKCGNQRPQSEINCQALTRRPERDIQNSVNVTSCEVVLLGPCAQSEASRGKVNKAWRHQWSSRQLLRARKIDI